MCTRHVIDYIECESELVSGLCCAFSGLFLLLFSKHSPGGECPKTLLSCCSVWAWRKPGIKSLATGRAHTHPESRLLRHPRHPRHPPYIYIYIRGSKGWVISGVSKGGLRMVKSTQKLNPPQKFLSRFSGGRVKNRITPFLTFLTLFSPFLTFLGSRGSLFVTFGVVFGHFLRVRG